VILIMKLMPVAHLVALILYSQQVSNFEHEICANGSPSCLLYLWVVSGFEHEINANGSCHCHTSVPSKLVSDFELEFSANSSHYHSDSVSSGCG